MTLAPGVVLATADVRFRVLLIPWHIVMRSRPGRSPRAGWKRGTTSPRALHQVQLDRHPRETESHDTRIKAHAYPTKRRGIQPTNEISVERDANHDTRNKRSTLSAMKLSFQNPLFNAYAVAASTMILKAVMMSWLTLG